MIVILRIKGNLIKCSYSYLFVLFSHMNPHAIAKLEKYINDFSWVLDTDKWHLLNELFAQHEKKTGEQIVVLFFPHREWGELLEIGLKVFHENGIWDKNLNNGLLLIVATEEKKIRIITGKGLELKYNEMNCHDIVENHLRPLLNAGKYEEMIELWNRITTDNFLHTTPWEWGKILWYNPQELQNIFEIIGKWDSSPKVSILTMIVIIPLSIIGLISLLIGWIGGIMLLFPVIFYITYKLLPAWIWKNHASRNSIYIWFIILILIIIWLSRMSYACMKNSCLELWWGSYSHSSNWLGNDSSYDSSYSSDSSSSFDWWGGSSNGGGYGD